MVLMEQLSQRHDPHTAVDPVPIASVDPGTRTHGHSQRGDRA
ncbi:hypothetical protein [Modestobacter marinus]|nr:hypothetical protein [Modestobacter marinus]